MPPRYAYWTILIDDQPTAFRAREQAELLPTLNQLKRKSANVVMRYFARGKLWDSPEQAQWAARNMPGQRERRGKDWRPGGEHKDPRAQFRDAERARRHAKRKRHHEARERDRSSTATRGPAAAEPARPVHQGFGPRPPKFGRHKAWETKPRSSERDRSAKASAAGSGQPLRPGKPRENRPRGEGRPPTSARAPWQNRSRGDGVAAGSDRRSPHGERRPWSSKPGDLRHRNRKPWPRDRDRRPPPGSKGAADEPRHPPERRDDSSGHREAEAPPRPNADVKAEPPKPPEQIVVKPDHE